MEKSFGELLQMLRKEKGWTQQQLADLLSVTNKTVSKWERNEAYPETSTLLEISKLFQITVDDLLNGRYQEEKKEADQSAFARMDMIHQWQTVKAGLFSKIVLLLGLTGFYGLYFYTHKFVPSFFLLACFAVISFAFLQFKYEKIKLMGEKKSSNIEWAQWIGCILAVCILLIPCINYPVKINSFDLFAEAMGGNLYPGFISTNGDYIVYVHVTFMNYLGWLAYLLPAAVCAYYGPSYFMVKRKTKQFKISLCTVGLVLIMMASTFFASKYLGPKTVMSAKAYQEFKSTYVTIAKGFDVLPANLSMIDSDRVNPKLEGKARYEKYMDISGFNDAQCTVYYQLSDAKRNYLGKFAQIFSYLITIGAVIVCVKKERE